MSLALAGAEALLSDFPELTLHPLAREPHETGRRERLEVRGSSGGRVVGGGGREDPRRRVPPFLALRPDVLEDLLDPLGFHPVHAVPFLRRSSRSMSRRRPPARPLS